MWGVFQLPRNPRQFEKILYGECNFPLLLLNGTHFNSRLPYVEHFSEDIIIVSIHAPQVVSTGQILADWRSRLCFNSRSPNGEHSLAMLALSTVKFFNSRFRTGSISPLPLGYSALKFQFTLPKRDISNFLRRFVSIHTPRMGSTYFG